MYKSYIKIGWRNLLRNKGYALINIGGLALGMAVAIAIGLWIHDELEFNKHHKNYARIGRIMKNISHDGEITTHPSLPYPLGNELRSKYGSKFKHVVMAWPAGDYILSIDDKNISMSGQFIEPAGAEMFSLDMLKGSWSGLNHQYAILLSKSAADALFGDEDPIDKLLKIDNRMDVKVTGVYEDFPHNSQFYGLKFFAPWDLLVSINQWIKYQGYTNNFLDIYVEMKEQADFKSVSNDIRNIIMDNIQNDPDYVTINPQIFLHPMKDWHLRSEWKNGNNSGGRIQIVWLFGVVGIFVLLLACINFMNLNTARYEKRAKEVGIRKAIGSKRTQLVYQFFSESFLVVVLAFVSALMIVALSLSFFNELAGKRMEMPLGNVYFWLFSVAFILCTGLLAGSYPAFYLSSFHPVKVLKGALRVGRLASIPRKALVVVQFSVSVTLAIGTIIVYQQIQFAKNRPIGYSRKGLLTLQITSPDFQGKYDVLRAELKNTGAVIEMAESSSPPTDILYLNGGFDWQGKDPDLKPELATFTVTPEYGKTIGWQFLKGRDFSRNLASDSGAFVVNEAAAKLMGFKNPVGETIRWNAGWRSNITTFTIIGVVKDMVMKSPYASPIPTVFFISPTAHHWINIKINPEISASDALLKIEAVFKKIVPSAPFDYRFADQEYDLKFAAEERIGQLTTVFAVLAIFISCLGLFGLASFIAAQRTKEIGIRKVVGASSFSVWKMLSKDFLILVIISCAIAIPTAYYLLAEWLKKYEYHTEISWVVFALTSLLALAITLLTVSYHALKAAVMNPVKSLRSE